MEFDVKLSVIQDVMSSVFDIVPQKMSTDVNAYIKLSSDDAGNILIHFTDIDLILKRVASVDRSVSGSCLIDVGLLYRSLSAFTADEDTMSYFKIIGQNLTIKTKTKVNNKTVSHKRVIPLFDTSASNFLDMPASDTIDVSTSIFLGGLKKISVSVAGFIDKNTYNGVLLDNDGEILKFVSFNGVSLTEYKIKSNISDIFTCVIPGKLIPKVMKLLSKISSETFKVGFSEDKNSFTIQADRFCVSFPLSKEVLRDHKKLLEGYKNCVTIDTELFLENIHNLGFTFDKDDKFRISLGFSNSELTLSSNESENTGIDVIGFNDEFHIDFNAHLLEVLVRNIQTEHFNLMFKESNKPVLVSPTGDCGYSLVSLLAPLQ
jgi:DNA polymerase III sliding clamp (beta) subunit (PCNA family)